MINRFCLPSGERIDCSREARSTPREWFKPQRSEDLNKELSGCADAEASYDRQPERSNKTGSTGRAAAHRRSVRRSARSKRSELAEQPAGQRLEILREHTTYRRVAHVPTFARAFDISLHVAKLLQVAQRQSRRCFTDPGVLRNFRSRGIRGAHQETQHESASRAIDSFTGARRTVGNRRRADSGWHVHILPDTMPLPPQRGRHGVPRIDEDNVLVELRDGVLPCMVTPPRYPRTRGRPHVPERTHPDGSTFCIATQSVEE